MIFYYNDRPLYHKHISDVDKGSVLSVLLLCRLTQVMGYQVVESQKHQPQVMHVTSRLCNIKHTSHGQLTFADAKQLEFMM